MSLEGWDRTATILHGLEFRADEIRRNMGALQLLLEAMQERPIFETRAESALAQLESNLMFCTAFVRTVREQYKKLPEVA